MKVKENQIFNLMDTNGRRNDVINAFQGYISILDEVTTKKKRSWNTVPISLAQFEFYQRAIELSPEVFKQHEPYDKLIEEIEKYPDCKKAIESNDVEYLSINYSKLLKKFDKGIEDRARHYTNNLVKLGFANSNRVISKVGDLLLDSSKLKKDRLESILPIDNINIIYLRQLLKLRIFDNDGEKYYSPFYMGLYMLIKKDRISENTFLEIVQGFNPYKKVEKIDQFVDNYEIGDIVNSLEVNVPQELKVNNLIEKQNFWRKFTNQKSQKQIEVYWKFYNLLYNFNIKKDVNTLEKLLTFFENEKDVLNKAFGGGKNIFNNRTGMRPEPKEFIEKHKTIFTGNLNENLYVIFIKSKQLDCIYEYSDTTKRIFKATGIISFDNGYVELAYKELLKCILKEDYLKDKIWGNISNELNAYYEVYDDYEEGIESYFCTVKSLCEILNLNVRDIDNIIIEIQSEFDGKCISEIPNIIADKRKREFDIYIDKVYPIERVKEILKLFKDRNNDKIIKNIVSTEATVPTIYEYIVGIAWYYFTGKKINLLESYNLTMSANFEPIIHAGGGQGDIVIYENNKVIMLEATLMNTNSQKRGEWEPVLRHSINLKIEEEINNTSRNVITFFIADKFDFNTINIWKAIASVPLQSTVYKDKFTDNVIIMPINNDEIINLMDKSNEYDEIIDKVRSLFETEKTSFDISWRDKFISQIM